MRKNLKELTKRFCSVLMVIGMLFQIFAPAIVLANGIPAVDGYKKVTIGGNPEFDSETGRFIYENGYITITKTARPATLDEPTPAPVPVTTTDIDVELGDTIKIVFVPNEGYHPNLYNDSENYSITLSGNEYEFEMHSLSEENVTYSLTPSFSIGNQNNNGGNEQHNQEDPIIKLSFMFNGRLFEDVSVGGDVSVPDNFNLDTISEFYITEISETTNGVENVYSYGENEYSKEMLGKNGLPIFDINKEKYGNNYLKLRVESHSYIYRNNPENPRNPIIIPNILESDLDLYNKTNEDYHDFYIMGINFIKDDFKGVTVSTSVMPDNYDFTMWNGVDLSSTTVNNPGKVTTYYGEDTINFNSETSSPVKKIELVEGKGVPSSAVEINNNAGTIKVLSNYYNEILVKVELQDGTIGYVNINRIGIFIGELNAGQTEFYHGAHALVENNLNVETNKQRIVAVFYHGDDTTYEDYDLIVNITYTDGTKETRLATGVGDIVNNQTHLTGSDYILYSGESIGDVESVSVTAVKKGATSNATKFGGATFGSGSGVVWENRR